MTATARTGAEALCSALHDAGIECVFGLPGTQNVSLFEALRTSKLCTIVATHELSAAMMANGYFRASGRVAALVTIPGPGFTWALTGLAEAALDSAALLHVVGQRAQQPGDRYQLQSLDQAAIARPLVKSIHEVEHANEIVPTIAAAYAEALAGEPGPVLVQVAQSALEARIDLPAGIDAADADAAPVDGDIDAVADVLRNARRCVILAGQGGQAAAGLVLRLAETLSAAVVTTTSGRGVVPEDHRLSLGFEFGHDGATTLNALIDASDVVLALGCKFSHNGSRGFRLRLPADKLIHIDASADVLAANYPARLAVRADVHAMLAGILARLDDVPRPTGFSADEIRACRARALAEGALDRVEPRIHGTTAGTPQAFFAALRKAMPRRSCLVTDSGQHQALARRHFMVLHPRGLLTPTNLQSMGFGISAAIGACLANPAVPVVALVGDGGLAMSGLELLTAVRERLKLTVIVFVDGAYGMIRNQQLAATGHSHGTEFEGPDCERLAAAVGADYMRVEGDVESTLAAALAADGVTLVEVAVGETLPMHWMRAKGLVRNTPPGRTAGTWLRRVLRRK